MNELSNYGEGHSSDALVKSLIQNIKKGKNSLEETQKKEAKRWLFLKILKK